jgi:diacylglycerol kinase family enzyme
MLRYSWGILRGGKHIHYRDVVYRKCRTVRVESEAPSPVQLDGDRFGHTPATFELAPRALQVLIPKSRKE